MTSPIDPEDPRFGEQGDTYVQPPDEKDDESTRNGLICFLDNGRECGSDCMASLTYTSTAKTTELSDQSRSCSLLVNFERLGIHSVIIAGILDGMNKTRKTAVADAARQPSHPTPNPLGG